MRREAFLHGLLTESRQVITPSRLTPFPVPSPSGRADVAAYWKDVAVAHSLYPLLHATEIAVRNSIDAFIRTGSGWRFAPAPIHTWMLHQPSFRRTRDWSHVVRAMGKLSYSFDTATAVWSLKSGVRPATHDDLVAATSFGFWSGLVTGAYVYARPGTPFLWPGGLAQVFPHYRGRRLEPVAIALNEVRQLRNRVFHYERLRHIKVAPLRQTMLEVIGWIAPTVATSLARIEPSAWALTSDAERDVEAMLLRSCAAF